MNSTRCDDYCCNYGCNQGRNCPARAAAKPDLRRQKLQAWAIALVSIAAAIVVCLDLFVWRA